MPRARRSFAADFDARACASVAELVTAARPSSSPCGPPDVRGGAGRGGAAFSSGGPCSRWPRLVPLADLRAGLAPGAAVARVMPNVAAAIGRGVFLFVPGTLSAAQAGAVRDLFGLAGTVVEVPESLFDAATAVAGCGPGFTALFIEALAEAGVGNGLDESDGPRACVAAVAGSAALVARDGDPVALREAIATPGGMTAEGIEVLESRGMRDGARGGCGGRRRAGQALTMILLRRRRHSSRSTRLRSWHACC